MSLTQYCSKSKVILEHLGFLIDDYKLKYSHITADSYNGFYGQSETFSFYNDCGCFTLHYLSQRGEWGWFYSNFFSSNQTELLKNEINQNEFIRGPVFGYRSMLKKLENSIRAQIKQSNCFFNINVN